MALQQTASSTMADNFSVLQVNKFADEFALYIRCAWSLGVQVPDLSLGNGESSCRSHLVQQLFEPMFCCRRG